MYNQPYFIPGYFAGAAPSMMRGAATSSLAGARGALGGAASLGAQGASRGLGLFGRLGSSFSAIKGINWGGLITNTSKTLNVVNQAIPLVRQVGPMMNNMKSMLRVASIFKDETDVNPVRTRSRKGTYNTSNNVSNYNNTSVDDRKVEDKEKAINNYNYFDNSPTFFVSS